MNGLHLIADLLDCQCDPMRLRDAKQLEADCTEACRRYGLTVVGQAFHRFVSADAEPAGVTGTVILAESHLAIHTWPEIQGVTLDIYVCNFSGDNRDAATALFEEVIAWFEPQRVQRQRLIRGALKSP